MPDPTALDLDAALHLLAAARLPFHARLAERIKHLAVAFADDYDGRQLSARSVAGLIDFLESAPPSGYPDLTLTPAGDCYAEWHGSPGRKVAIEFLDSGDARYLLFRPNPKHPQRVDRLTGTTTIDALAETMAPFAPLTGLAAVFGELLGQQSENAAKTGAEPCARPCAQCHRARICRWRHTLRPRARPWDQRPCHCYAINSVPEQNLSRLASG